MNIQNARRWAPRGVRPWFGAAAALILASTVRLLLHPLLGPVMPGSAFCIAAVLVEYYFGLAPALVVMVFGLPIADYLFVPPYRMISVFDRRDVILLVAYPTITLLILGLIESLRRVQYQAELLTRVARSRYDMLLRADNERALAERATDTTHRLLDLLTSGRDGLLLCKTPDSDYRWHAPEREDDDVGAFFDSLHPEDRARLAADATPGPHTLRTDVSSASAPAYVAERFTTQRGDFVVVRRPDQETAS